MLKVVFFLNNCFNKDSFSIFNESFKLVSTTHSHNTRSARNSDFILHTFKKFKFKFKFYHSTKGRTFSFLPCYIRYTLLITGKFPVEFSLLMPLLH